MADLITLNEYKAFLGLPQQSAPSDDQVTALLPAASRAVQKYTDRNFEIAGTPATRTFEYDGSGILDIDECTAITAVESDLGYGAGNLYPLDATEYTPQPHREQTSDDPYYYMLVRSYRLPVSPEMGFERNLDTLGFLPAQPVVHITATWGWPVIPADVKLATAIVTQDLQRSKTESGGSTMTSESIAGYARSWQANPNTTLALPNRARDLLINYIRVYG